MRYTSRAAQPHIVILSATACSAMHHQRIVSIWRRGFMRLLLLACLSMLGVFPL
jgi:hypothetical protein